MDKDEFRGDNVAGRGHLVSFLAMLFLIMLLTWASSGKIKGENITKDAEENTLAGFHLWTAGKFSTDGTELSYFREPLPVGVIALHMALFTDIPKTASSEQLTRDPRYAKQISRVNLFYVTGALLALWLLAWLLTRSHLVGALAIVGSWLFLFFDGQYLRRPLSEFPAALCITLNAVAVVGLVRKQSPLAAGLTGVSLGVIALIKTAGLYVAVLTMPLLVVSLFFFKQLKLQRATTLLFVMACAFALTVTPWMTRNYLNFGEFAIAQRGGITLLLRATKNLMTEEEYRGAFYVYAPAALKKFLFEPILGFKKVDLQPGGRYVRLIRSQPEDKLAVARGDHEMAVSYFSKASVMLLEKRNEFFAQGLPARLVDNWAQREALQLIRLAPGKHLSTTPLFAWRGLWSFYGSSLLSVVAANLFSFSIFLTFPIIAIYCRRPDWFAFSIFGLGFMLFHAFLTHFIPRYSAPLIPLAILSVLILLHALLGRGRQLINLMVSQKVSQGTRRST